ncbi:MAG: sensor histidine kinase [Solirubrobacteraceae bacterium]|nr:sensor histidine kinase [Patulibacter sp.]
MSAPRAPTMYRPFSSSTPTPADPAVDPSTEPEEEATADETTAASADPTGVRRRRSGDSWRADETIHGPRSSGLSLFSQVLAVNTVIIIATVFVASVAARLDIDTPEGLKSFLVAILAILITALVNGWILRRRFGPLSRLIHAIEAVDLERPIIRTHAEKGEPVDVEQLRSAVERMLGRLDLERRRRTSAVIDAQEAERARLARDLHDEVNQSLTGIMLRLSALARDADETTQAGLQEVRDLTEQAMLELLRLSHDLRPTALDDLGLSAALEAQLQRIDQDTDLVVAREISNALPTLTPEQQTVLFRVAQEALSNVVQHSGATTVSVFLQPAGQGVLLRVVDDGCGIGNRRSPSKPFDRETAGLTGMRERAMLVGGSLDLQSSSSGTSVELVL